MMKIKSCFLLLSFFLIGKCLSAWDPLTHMIINETAYQQALTESGSDLIITAENYQIFVGGAPSPDMRQTGGPNYPVSFHNDIETIKRMIEIAKDNPKFGVEDVLMALGWAGHLFAEVPSAHTSTGYPNTKISCTVQNPKGLNHSISEFAVDLLTYHENKALLAKAEVVFPIRLLESAMAEELKNGTTKATLTAEEIKSAANAFLPDVVGIKAVAEYLDKNRPELFDELDSFYSDRREPLKTSINDVKNFLLDFARRDFKKSLNGSADGVDSVGIALNGSLTQKGKQLALGILGKALKTGDGSDAVTMISYYFVRAGLSNSLWRDSFLKAAFASNPATGSSDQGRNQKIFNRYLEGLLTRYDLTYPEILAYAQQGYENDSATVEARKAQFVKQGLKGDGRKEVKIEEAMVAVREVERIETVRNQWPWFWPWRPDDLQLAEAREKASRLISYAISDGNLMTGDLLQRANYLLDISKSLRKEITDYKNISIINPLEKFRKNKELSALSETCGKEERILSEIIRIKLALGQGSDSSTKLSTMQNQTLKRISETENNISQAKVLYGQTPTWNLVKRDLLNDNIKQLEQSLNNLKEYLEVLNLSSGAASSALPSSTGFAVASAPLVIENSGGDCGQNLYSVNSVKASPSYLKALANFEKAYKSYSDLIQKKKADDPEVKQALLNLQEANRMKNVAK
ncbi:MAG: zinc dependent phospholipase C family protein [Candidatus Riflebacteria bacterium]|nr:zinc dependent phospholipase C family protein [Candidatus Riflebacteria bacterium]